ncbi:DUF7002 family protein [Nocardioides baculatus]|uniref:Uncharacterized protein n=1 Tax=Nocardioides baculatus TaxID=2801337 RepID=A0ABS1L4W7_9ACTN|nr:hypothetical protein [Nocardioides baculatus]MBL0746730.1 hypothetical protein [Nocardioides baculatus]
MDLGVLLSNYPRLFHMAEAGSWEAIQRIGLKTTAQLVHECTVDSTIANQILHERRSHGFRLQHPVVGDVVIRDQGPLKLHNLEPSLIDVTVAEWLHILNSRVFFWLDERRLNRLLQARLYRDIPHDVLVIDTERLVATHLAKVRLSPMNTGATIFPGAPARGTQTFTAIDAFPFQERRKGRALEDVVVELSVLDGVPDVAEYVIEVQRRVGSEIRDVIYQRNSRGRFRHS